jgi:NAD(P)-dependent dehydrogenase (short-subunit alcohol dehydrogenase family)
MPGLIRARCKKRDRGGDERTDFSGKQILVVGGSSGIGNGIAPADMAGAAPFLASPPAFDFVGQTLVVDGGLIL